MDVTLMSGDQASFVSLRLLEVNSVQATSIRVRAEYAAPDFGGRNDHVWFWLSDLDRFVEALWKLHRNEAGIAELISLSPAEFVFTVAADSPARDKLAQITISKASRLRDYDVQQTVSGGFVVDHGAIHTLTQGFVRLRDAVMSGTDIANT